MNGYGLAITITTGQNLALGGLLVVAFLMSRQHPLYQFYMFLCLIMFWRLLKNHVSLRYVEV